MIFILVHFSFTILFLLMSIIECRTREINVLKVVVCIKVFFLKKLFASKLSHSILKLIFATTMNYPISNMFT